MSIRLTEEVTCPKCGKKYDLPCYPSVNGAVDEDIRAAVLDGSAFVATCPHCGVTTKLVYPCFYQDTKRGFAVYFIPRTEARTVVSDGNMNGLLEDESIKLRRVVDDYMEFVEKIQLFERGMNDRAIELFKTYTALSMMDGKKESFVPDHLVFQDELPDGKFLFLGTKDKKSQQLTVPKQLYHAIMESSGGALAVEQSDDFVMIDMLWALDLLKQQGTTIDEDGVVHQGVEM